MSKPKPERNKLILELADKGYTYKQTLEELRKKGFTGLKDPKSVGMQLSRLKRSVSTSPRQPVGKVIAPRRRVSKVTLPQRQVAKETATRQPVPMETEKMAFWLDRDIKEKLKILAVKERRTASDIVRELLRKYLKNK